MRLSNFRQTGRRKHTRIESRSTILPILGLGVFSKIWYFAEKNPFAEKATGKHRKKCMYAYVFVLQKIKSYIRCSGHPQSFWRHCQRHRALELSTGWRCSRNTRLFMYASVQWERERSGIIYTQMLTEVDCLMKNSSEFSRFLMSPSMVFCTSFCINWYDFYKINGKAKLVYAFNYTKFISTFRAWVIQINME